MNATGGLQRFQAKLQKTGVNLFVEVPARVSSAMEGFAHSGRIRVAGQLNTTPMQGTLVPVAGGRHRLFVNGGMRSAAKVGLGDLVSIELRPTKPNEIVVPDDLATGLRRVPGALAAFNAQPVSRRRELIRYIVDARTPQSRERRIAKTADHILGKEAPPAKRFAAIRERPLWTCPRCGNQFVNKNGFHSCRRWSLDEAFRGRPAFVRELFQHVRALIETCGPVRMVPYRDRVGFMVRVRFAGATPKRDCLEIGFWLPRRIASERFHKVETIYPNAHIHVLRIRQAAELDSEVFEWIKEAYAVGCQQHLLRSG
jgi:Bacteriocin-protection, YdeI or OmpD-Associated/Domain of unknown function (DUF5655)/Domain of unknown function (DUF1905)